VLGPGHRWPTVLRPIYAILSQIPATRDAVDRLGLVTLARMVNALVASVERGPCGIRLVSVPEIRSGNSDTAKVDANTKAEGHNAKAHHHVQRMQDAAKSRDDRKDDTTK
jgi:hypothetical protein